MTEWPIEKIPDGDDLLMRVHKTWFKRSGIIGTGAFQNRGEGMSTDWSKYSTREQTQGRGRVPHQNAVVQINVGEVRSLPDQRVQHTPIFPDHRAHTDVFGQKDEEVRLKLRDMAKVVLPIPI